MRDNLYWVWLAERLGAGNKRVREVIDRFGSAFDIYRTDPDVFSVLDKGRSKMGTSLGDKNLSDSVRICEACERLGVEIISIADERYPKRLAGIQNPPVVLYVRGKLPDLNDRLCIGVVGTRKMSEYGCRATYTISYGLAATGAVTVSGMASGVDSVTAVATFAAGGHTVAVLGCGIDRAYPAENRLIYNELLSKGTIVSEYPPGTAPTRYTFPMRNRIISGLSQGVFVVEADMRSGAMITARDALLQGRTLFALPGNVGEANSNGTNQMIRDGAFSVTCAEDILREFLPLYSDAVDVSLISGADKTPKYDTAVLQKYGIIHVPEAKTDAELWQTEISRQKSAKPAEKVAAEKKESDGSREAYASLDPSLKAVYDKMPAGESVSIDRLTGDGLGAGDVIAALTLLEIEGLVVSLPGGLYSKA